MSLLVDSIFIKSLQANAALKKAVDGRIYGSAVPVPDKDLLNVPVPYIVVSFDGFQNSTEDKDDGTEGCEDTVQVGILVVAGTLPALHTLMESVRKVIREACASVTEDNPRYDDYPEDYTVTGSAIGYDPDKPCYYFKFTYNCVVFNNTDK